MLAPSCAGNQGWDRHPGPAEVPLGPDNKQLRWVPTDVRIRGILAGKAVLPNGVWMTALDLAARELGVTLVPVVTGPHAG
jgi:hypothetical protein